MVDSTYGWNIISDDYFFLNFMDKLKMYMFATEQHVLENLGVGGLSHKYST